jgi:hypothetical protein
MSRNAIYDFQQFFEKLPNLSPKRSIGCYQFFLPFSNFTFYIFGLVSPKVDFFIDFHILGLSPFKKHQLGEIFFRLLRTAAASVFGQISLNIPAGEELES